MNQSEFLAITRNLLKAREKSRAQGQGAIGFGFSSIWLNNGREIFKSVTKRRNQNRVITFDNHLKIVPLKYKSRFINQGPEAS